MSFNSLPKSDVESALARELETLQKRMADFWSGHEKEALIMLVRLLDATTISDTYFKRPISPEREEAHAYIKKGAAAALRPFLAAVKGESGGVPWGPIPMQFVQHSLSYLEQCGRLTHLRRMACLERYGLASTSIPAPNEVLIKIPNSSTELAARFAADALDERSPTLARSRPFSEKHWGRIHGRMKRYVGTELEWFIRYSNDLEIVEAYHKLAAHSSIGLPEGEAFPADVVIGDRSFGKWKEACNRALGRILTHIDFCHFLSENNPSSKPHDLYTLYVRRDDLEDIWHEAGQEFSHIKPTMEALTLSIDNLDDYENSFEMPCPFYVDLGRYFVLIPCFEALTNSYLALFRHLRSEYKPDWDRGVDKREEVFRADLRSAFPEPYFFIPLRGYVLRRTDGSAITDIDAVVIDQRCGTLVLVQLKWHDVFGYSLTERESRRKNIAKANEWIDRVTSWVAGRSSADISQALGINVEASTNPPLLFVLARYTARFSGEINQDRRAAWMGWAEVRNAIESATNFPPISDIPHLVAAHEAQFTSLEEAKFTHRFRGLTAHLHITREE